MFALVSWAWIAAQGSGTVTTTADQATVYLSGSAGIHDLDNPTYVQVNGYADKPNRSINGVAIGINSAALPAGGNASWFQFSVNGGSYGPSAYVPTQHTFVNAYSQDNDFLPFTVQLRLAGANTDQSACIGLNNVNLLSLSTI